MKNLKEQYLRRRQSTRGHFMGTPPCDQSGMVTADFLFSFILATSFCILFFAFSVTFTVTEIAQYIAFSSARAFSAGHMDPNTQKLMAQNKFKELKNNKDFRALFNTSSWFQIKNFVVKDGVGGDNFDGEYGKSSGEPRIPFVGVRFDFTASLLNLRIPFIGRTGEGGADFSARVTGFLIREPTSQECFDQMSERYPQLLKVYSQRGVSGKMPSNFQNISVGKMEDNGC